MLIQKNPSNSQSNLEKEEWNWRNQSVWLQSLLQSHSHQDSTVPKQRQKYRSMEQNRKPKDKFMHLWTPYLWQRRQDIQWRKENPWSATCKRIKLEHFVTPYTKINSKWVKDLNVRAETIKLLEENIGKTLSNINHSRILYDPPPRILEIKAKINKWDPIKIKSLCTTKGTISKVKDSLQIGRK